MKCKRCKCEFERKTNNQKYCSDCAYVVHLEYMRGYMRYRRSVGGTHDDYCREIKRLGFKRQFS